MKKRKKMKSMEEKIVVLVSSEEMKLLKEACLFGADVDENLKCAIEKKGGYRIEFSEEELEDLIGFVAACANHEKSRKKEKQWDLLCDKLDLAPEKKKEKSLLECIGKAFLLYSSVEE